jgi:hypothetical protein
MKQKSTKSKRSNKMGAPSKFGKMKLVITDAGQVGTATASPTDSVNLPTTIPAGNSTPVWTASDPGVVVTPVATDPTGLSATVVPATPPVLVASFTVTVTTTLADGVTVLTGTSSPNSVVAGGPTGFQISVV